MKSKDKTEQYSLKGILENHGAVFENTRAILHALPDIVYKIDQDGRFTFVNDSVRILGYKPQELVGKHFSTIIHPDDVEIVSRFIVLPKYSGKVTGDEKAPKLFDERRSGERKTTNLEIRLLPKGQKQVENNADEVDGSLTIITDVAAEGYYDRDTDGRQFLGTIGIIRDISKRKRLEERLKAIHSLGQRLILSRDVKDIARAVIEVAQKTLNLRICSLWLVDEEKKNLVRWAHSEGAPDIPPFSIEGDQGITVAVFRSGKLIYLPDVSKDSRYVSGDFPARSELCVPLKVSNKVLGVLNAESDRLNAFKDADKQLLITLADQIAIVVENAMLFKEIEKSEQRYRAISENSADAIVSLDPELKIVGWSSGAERIFGYERGEIIGQSWDILLPEDERQSAAEMLEEVKKKGFIHGWETKAKRQRKDGRLVIVEITLTNLGPEFGFTAILRDITERKQAQEALQKKTEQQEKFLTTARHLTESLELKEVLRRLASSAKEILDAYDCTIYLLDEDGKTIRPVITVEPTYEKEILATPLDIDGSFTGQALRAKCGLIFNDAGVNPLGQQIEGTPDKKDERIIVAPFIVDAKVLGAMCLNRFGSLFTEEDLSLANTFATYAATALKNAQTYNDLLNEVEEHRKTAEAWQTEKAYFNQLLENAQEAIIMTDNYGAVVHANKEFLRLFGYRLDEVLGKSVDELVAPKDVQKEAESVTQRATKGEKIALEAVRQHKDGTLIDVSILASPIIVQGRQVAVYGIYRDITDRRRAENNLRLNFEKLQKTMVGTISAMASMLETRDPYTAGHQLRVAALAVAIAQEMGLSDQQIIGLRMAAVIHDIGKIYIPAEILSRPTTLTEYEFALIKTHPQVAYNILKTIEFPWPVADIVLQHHETLDGSGYPQGLTDKDILLEAKILGVADIVEAMSSHRPYRPARGLESTLKEISAKRGILYDAQVVDVCLKLFKEKGFTF